MVSFFEKQQEIVGMNLVEWKGGGGGEGGGWGGVVVGFAGCVCVLEIETGKVLCRFVFSFYFSLDI